MTARVGRLPADYRALVDTYGPGTFDEFLWVLQPSAANPNLDLERQRTVRIDALREVAASGEPVPYPVDTLLPWAVTDNGDVCYWLTSGTADAGTWPVVVNGARGPEWVSFTGSATAFLAAVLAGELVVAVFPDDFPSERPEYRQPQG
ncbi:MAG TPA: hypothetical protein VFQ85_08455 [Mycobacteriales bacterium]|nr:hypothetical protein [Mycobacteriales bacterium]